MIAVMAFITLAFSVQGNQAIAEPTVVPVPTIVQISTPSPTAVPDNGTQQTQYGYVITYPEAVKSFEINVNQNPDYVATKSTATATATATVTPKPTVKPSPTHKPIPTIKPKITVTPKP